MVAWNPFEGFTLEQIKMLAPDGRGSKTKENWDKLSEEEKQERLKNSFHSSEAREKSEEASRQFWASRTPEEIERHIRSSFLSPEAIKKSGEGYSRFYSSLTEEEKKEFKRRRVNSILAFWGSSESKVARQALSEAGQNAWASKTEEEKREWLKSSMHSEEARLKAEPRISEGLRRYWASLTDEERVERYKGLRSGPSGPELFLGSYLEDRFPGKWAYNGDGNQNIAIGRRIPDFVRRDGEKEVISEMGGLGYCHFLEDEVKEVEHYRRYGYACLVIWEWECYDWKGLDSKFGNVKESELPNSRKYIGAQQVAEGGGLPS